MKMRNSILLMCLLLLASCNFGGEQSNPREKILFNSGWQFALGDYPEAVDISFDASAWRVLTLPHDWAIEGDFSEDNPSGCGGGALPGGIGWYRKLFKVDKADLAKHIRICFDGVYMNSVVYVNGKEVGYRPYGYISFEYDITSLLVEGENVIAVKVDNSDQPNSRWYSGCGIYRNVWMLKMEDIHVGQWGTFITTPMVNETKADVNVETRVTNERDFRTCVEVRQNIVDRKGNVVASTSIKKIIDADTTDVVSQQMRIGTPHLWQIDSPYLYTLVTEIIEGEKLRDRYTTSLGVRSFYFDSEKGFILNDSLIKINGVCMHHDLGCLGAVVNRRGIERQLQILKEMGCNGIRCSHNPPSPELLELCDSMGFIVMDEAFDMWRKKKTENDYARFFDKWHERDLTDLIVRDRNHPSVFMWSIGNEVLEQWSDANADTLDIQAANLILNMKRDPSSLEHEAEGLSVNSLLCQHLVDIVKRLDSSRPVTAGNNEPDPGNHLFRSGALDMIGYNYHIENFADVPSKFPHKPFIVTESVSALMTRGYYKMPSDVEFLWPERWDKPFHDPSFSCSSYDNCHAPWGSTHEQTMRKVKYMQHISGQYVWTGFDYIGEPTPYWWPARSSYFGIVDLAGFPKDIYYMYKSEWTDEDVLHLFPHWNWKDGQEVDMWCYYNNAEEVELFVNGKSCGAQRKDSLHLHTSWRVNFVPGEVKVVAKKGGKAIRQQIIKTAGYPYELRLSADRTKISADGRDLAFITVEVVDKSGNLCPLAENLITFETEGTAFIAGVDNGSPISLERFKDDKRKAFYGKCLVVLQSDGKCGNVRLIARSEGLGSAEITVNCLPIRK
ncbi:MAG: DUF4982 domain-containing protein [Marinilabiliaceae bacterium]|nr:DUF4982 domain-containing protein [Marinilabiliaceae bacterium]